jgi:hypothetical protein
MEWWSNGVEEWWSNGVVEWWSGGVVEWWAEGYREGNHIAIRASDRYAQLMARSLVVLLLFIGAGCLFGQDQTPSKPKQFIYVLRLVARLL